MARPSQKIKRDDWLPKIRVSQSELDAIAARCREAGLTMSAYIRTMAIEGAVIQRDDGLADKKLIAGMLGAIGNNINQLSRRANVQDNIDPLLADELREALARVKGLAGSMRVDP